MNGNRPTLSLVLIVLVAIGGLFALDVFLAKAERAELQNEAARLYQQGSELLAGGRAAEALEPLKHAQRLARGNPQYELQLVTALLAAGRLDEAETDLEHVLAADPNNGPANLLAARLRVRQGRIADAEAHYHRAIYGAWPENAAEQRLQVRLELVRFLAAHGLQKDLLAELLPLDSENLDLATKKEVAHLYLEAGSPARSAAAYQALIGSNPDNPAAYAGLGDAELALGDYRKAWAAFLNADRRMPGNPELLRKKELASTLTMFDPTPRSLSSAEKYDRSSRILASARDSLSKCSNGSAATAQLVSTAADMLAKKRPAHVTNELAEERLALAEQLWRERVRICGASSSAGEEPLRLIMAKLAQ